MYFKSICSSKIDYFYSEWLKNCNRYSAEFKAKVASDAMRLGPVEAGRRWSVPKSTVADWKKIYMKQWGPCLFLSARNPIEIQSG